MPISSKTTIIAEVGSVHDGSFGNAGQLIDAAAECGANAVKFQHHLAAEETLPDAPAPPHFNTEPRYSYFQRTSFDVDQWRKLKERCDERGVEFLCSPFSVRSVEILERIGVNRYKVASGEVTNIPLLDSIARTGRPVFLSSGMSSWDELDQAVNTILRHHDRVTVLQCTSEYPCPPEHVGLNVMLEIKDRYKLSYGLSDHTQTNYSAFAAVVLGASAIEKHLTFSRKMYGSDAKYASEPLEFTELVRGIRAIEVMLSAKVNKNDIEPFKVMKATFEKSVVSLVEIPQGAIISADMVAVMKPGTGLAAYRCDQVIGRRTTRRIPARQVLQENDIDWNQRAPR